MKYFTKMSYKFDIFSGYIPFFRRVLRAVFTLLSPSAGCYLCTRWLVGRISCTSLVFLWVFWTKLRWIACPWAPVQSVLSVVSTVQSYLFLICSSSAGAESAYLICCLYLELKVPRRRWSWAPLLGIWYTMGRIVLKLSWNLPAALSALTCS